MNLRRTTRKVFGAGLASLTFTVGAVILAATPAFAAAFADGGFETPAVNAPYVTVVAGGTIGPWTVTGTSVDIITAAPGGFAVSEGNQAVDLSGSPGPGGVQQAFDTVPGTTYQVQYDVANRCGAGPDFQFKINGVLTDSTVPAGPAFETRSFTFTAAGASSTLDFLTTVNNNQCGVTLDNVRIVAVTSVTSSPATQCTGAPGHNVLFRKVTANLNSLATADAAMSTDPSAPSVIARATDNGVPTINYSDAGGTVASQAPFAPQRDVGTPPLTPVAGTFNPGGLPSGEDDNWVMRSSGYISVPTAGVWNFTVHGDDMFRLAIGSPPQVVSFFANPAADSTTTAPVYFPAAGCYYYTLEHANNLGPSAVSLSATGPGQATPTLVGLGLLPVFRGVDNPTTCKITPGSPPGTQDVTVTDLDTIGSIFNVLITNGTVAIISPNYIPGVSTTVVLRATKTTPGQPTKWSFNVSDWNDHFKLCQ